MNPESEKTGSALRLLRVILVLLIVLALGIWGIRYVAQTCVTAVIRQALLGGASGFLLTFDDVSLDIVKRIVTVRQLTVRNPSTFAHTDFLSIPELSFSLNFRDLIEHRALHLEHVKVLLEHVTLVRDQEGVWNIALLPFQPHVFPGEARGPVTPDALPVIMDQFQVSLQHIRVADFSDKNLNKDVDLGLEHRSFSNVMDGRFLTGWILLHGVALHPELEARYDAPRLIETLEGMSSEVRGLLPTFLEIPHADVREA